MKVREVLNLYKNWFLKIVKGLFFICLLTFGLALIMLVALVSAKIQIYLAKLFDEIMGLLL